MEDFFFTRRLSDVTHYGMWYARIDSPLFSVVRDDLGEVKVRDDRYPANGVCRVRGVSIGEEPS